MRRFAAISAALGWAALVLQLFLSLRLSVTQGKGLLDGVIAYFGYFTIWTNVLVAVALTASLVRDRSGIVEFFSRPRVRTGIATSITVVGVVYILFLRRTWDPRGLQLVADVLLHYAMPVLFLAFWWLAVPKESVRWRDVGAWTLYPIVYLLFALARGALSGVYSYPFIDVARLGYARVLGNALGVLLGFLLVALLLVAAARVKRSLDAMAVRHRQDRHLEGRSPFRQ